MKAELDGFQGALLAPRDPGYEEARRIWNGAIERRPALIAGCTGTPDVVAAVRYGREARLDVAVRGGGHQVAGHSLCDRGLVIDCSPMRRIEVDPVRRTARAQAGVLWGELDHATQRFGLATTGGVVTHTGIAGLTLGGGIGWLMRKHGLTADNLLSAELVTADGQTLRVSSEHDPELYWALRGGGGNFGVVTWFEFRLHEVGPVLAGIVAWPIEDAPEVLRFYRDFIREAPDELMSIVKLRGAPALPEIPAELHGRPVCIVALCWSGDLERGSRALRPLREHGSPLLDLVAARPYVEHQAMFDPAVPHGLHWYWKSAELGCLGDEVIDVVVDHAAAITSPLSYTVIFQLGGAVARIPEDATAYSHRAAAHNVNINAGWRAGDRRRDEHVAWAHSFHAGLEPHQSGVYVNFLGDEGRERVRAAYGAAKYDRLAMLKQRYDPDNFFRHNHNIEPSQQRSRSSGACRKGKKEGGDDPRRLRGRAAPISRSSGR